MGLARLPYKRPDCKSLMLRCDLKKAQQLYFKIRIFHRPVLYPFAVIAVGVVGRIISCHENSGNIVGACQFKNMNQGRRGDCVLGEQIRLSLLDHMLTVVGVVVVSSVTVADLMK